MVNHIYGKIVFITKNYLVLETNGIGYKLNYKLPQSFNVGDYARFYIHCLIKSDIKNVISTELYAFNSSMERNLFVQLIAISGIGPIIATNIIDVGYKNVIQAIINEDIDFLTNIKGINEKIAKHIIVSLLDQYVKIAESLNISKNCTQENEFIQALKQLGYSKNEINFALKTIDHNLDLDERIGKSIKAIATNHGNS